MWLEWMISTCNFYEMLAAKTCYITLEICRLKIKVYAKPEEDHNHLINGQMKQITQSSYPESRQCSGPLEHEEPADQRSKSLLLLSRCGHVHVQLCAGHTPVISRKLQLVLITTDYQKKKKKTLTAQM